MECYSCGSRPCDTPFPTFPPRKLPRLCCDCLASWAWDQGLRGRLAATRAALRLRAPTSRAGYRAALRWRTGLPQLDLVDAVVRAP